MLFKYKLLHLIFVLAIIAIAANWGDRYRYSDIKDVLSTLQNISAMIFTIAGIWLAYIYPKAISGIIKPSSFNKDVQDDAYYANPGEIVKPEISWTKEEKKEIEKDVDRITMIVETILTSAFVIFAIVLINVFKPAFSGTEFVKSNLVYISRISCFVIFSLVYLQIISLITIVYSNIAFLNDMHDRKNNEELDKLR